jgi:hypothetical protein
MRVPVPSLQLYQRKDEYNNSLANISKRVYPLNLNKVVGQPRARTGSKPRVPEFIREYVKDPGKPKIVGNVKSYIKHTRSVSFQPTPYTAAAKDTEVLPVPKIPCLSYKDFKNRHREPPEEPRLFTPQIISITKRSKIILNASKPIIINPALYSKKNSNRKSTSIDKSSIQSEPETTTNITPGLTYGEKILKLRSLISSDILQ